MLAIRLDPEIEHRLSVRAERTRRTKTFYAREAILEHLEDLEDIYMAKKVLAEGGRYYSSKEIESELGL